MKNRIFLSFFLLAIIFATPPALADKGGNPARKGGAAERTAGNGNYAGAAITIGIGERALIRNYLADHFARGCPPGLAKKNNGCLPPGQARKYRVGHPLEGSFLPIPDDLLGLLSPLPRGYRYVQVDQDVLLISEASKKVIDAVTLLSAVGD